MKTLMSLIVILTTISFAAFAGKGDMAGAPKPYPSFGEENIQALVRNPQVRQLLQGTRSIAKLDLVGHTAGRFYYHVKTNDSCTFTVLVENDHHTLIKDVKAKLVRSDLSCRQKPAQTGKVGEQNLQEIDSLVESAAIRKINDFEYGIFSLQLTAKKDETATYRVHSSNVLESRQCVLDVQLKNGKATAATIVSGCRPQVDDNEMLKSVRLDCSFDAHVRQDNVYNNASDHIGNSTGLEFQEVPGTDELKCVVGCTNTAWKRAEMKTLSAASILMPGGADVAMPRIRFEKADHSLTLKFEMAAGLQTTGGEKFTEKKTTEVFVDDNHMIFAEARRTIEQDPASGVRSLNPSSEIRCELIKPGVRSEAYNESVKNRAAAPGKIRMADYENNIMVNIIHNENGLFADSLKLAMQIDPAQIESGLPQDRFTEGLKWFAPTLREALKTFPGMTNGQAWALTEKALAGRGYSTGGLIAFARLPLVLLP